ncbi:FAD-dependent oxidoreductase [Nonomuraea sp. NPDC050643]|uniref:FAD-dependent oxidoreductase n=1 Tax=Nonomuraea sp. NPDC050643 TaxID=3155660 RepID=UPI0033D51C9A
MTIVDPAERLLPAFLPELRQDLHRRLDELDIRLRLGAGLTAPPETEPGKAGPFTVTTTGGEVIAADIWFQAHGMRVNSDYLADGQLPTPDGPAVVPASTVSECKGADLFTGRFTEQFG